MSIVIKKNADELAQYFADWIVAYIAQVLATQNRFTIALSGGTTPQKLYGLLATGAYKNKIDWERIHFFWGDERAVPFTDKRNNAGMAFESLLNHVPVPKEHIHIMPTDIKPGDAAIAYEKILKDYFPDDDHSFNLVLLGLGDNAHTLSLFPGSELIHEKNSRVKSFYLEEEKIDRITLTAPIVNAADRVAFLVAGAGKAAALFHVLTGEHDPDLYPAQVIQPYNDELYWFVDQAAYADLER